MYSEQESYFSISHKVDLLIRQKLNYLIGGKLQISRSEKEKYLNLIVSTNKNTTCVDAKGPDVNNKEGFVNWGLWLPYYEIVNNTNQVESYLSYYFDAVVLVFNNYNVPEEDIRKVQRIVADEIVGNPNYNSEEETLELDLSDIE